MECRSTVSDTDAVGEVSISSLSVGMGVAYRKVNGGPIEDQTVQSEELQKLRQQKIYLASQSHFLEI